MSLEPKNRAVSVFCVVEQHGTADCFGSMGGAEYGRIMILAQSLVQVSVNFASVTSR